MPAIKVGAVKQGTSQDSQKPILKETEFTVSSVISYVHGGKLEQQGWAQRNNTKELGDLDQRLRELAPSRY